MGDVAMTVPVIHSMARQHDELRVTVLTKKANAQLFAFAPSNVEVMGVDLSRYAGVMGLERLFRELHKRRFDAVADFHDVLRSKFLCTRFRMSGIRVTVIDKGRKARHALIAHGDTAAPLRPVTDSYADVLRQLGIAFRLDFERAFNPRLEDFGPVHRKVGRKKEGERWVGIAPFAAHEGKIYPLERMRQVAGLLADSGLRVFIFGAGERERQLSESWERDGITSVCGRLGGLRNEMLLMSQLDAMIAMDSANMHIAALVGTPVISIWGATHPKMGFAPWRQPAENIIQTDGLPCRPCSVFGNKPCRFGDLRCLTAIQPQFIVNRCLQVIRAAAAHS